MRSGEGRVSTEVDLDRSLREPAQPVIGVRKRLSNEGINRIKLGVTDIEMPLTAERVWQAVRTSAKS